MLVSVIAVAIAVIGIPAVASAAPVGPGKLSTTATVAANCANPKPGYAACYSLRRTDVKATKGLQPAVTPAGFGANDLQSAYALPANGGAGATVAIVDAFDDPTAEADLAVYRQQYGLPACTTANGCFSKVNQRGGSTYPTPDQGWAGEISLDLDMVSASAPGAHIILVETDSNSFDDLAAGVDEAVALGAKFVSNSYGSGYTSTPGSGEDPTETTAFDPHYNHPGVAVVASSGDSDYGVGYPAASQFVTAVGGTALATATNARGWTESVWHNSYGGPGSGCSLYEPKPSFQHDTGCSMRAEADVSAVADPLTGVSVYQTFGNSGWAVYGGTSVSAPLITGVYAVAGTPVAGTYPNSYPYANPGALNDVTTGFNGTCSPAYLCTAGPGYDGPTGLGTPNGTAAFSTGPHGQVAGTVTDSVAGTPVAGATVTAGTATASTDAAGHYSLQAPVGTYDVTVAAYGYATATLAGVVVTDGGTITENVALVPVARAAVSGTVTDGSGHGWPLYAKVTVDGVPGGPVFTDPATGHYSLNLPQGQTYQLHVTPVYNGYTTKDVSVVLGASNTVANVSVPVDAESCTAPGYAVHLVGSTQTFDGTTAPAGWTVANNTASGGWQFTDDGNRGNVTGGSGGFAIVDSDHLGGGNSQDTVLTAPPVTFPATASPAVSFANEYRGFSGQTASVDLTVDGGATWTSLWSHGSDSVRGPSHVDLQAPQAAGKTAQLRFHFTSSFGWWWEVDDVFIGSRTCDPTPGGLVFGNATDKNTAAGLNGAVVTSTDAPTVSATSAATPEDPNLGDGFYWLFSALTGNHPFTAAKSHYATASKTVNVAVDFATRANFVLKAGRITVTPTSVTKTLNWGATGTATVTVKNTGSAPATVQLSERSGGFELLTQGGAALQQVKGAYSPYSRHNKAGATMKPNAVAPTDANPSAAPWTAIANYPTPIQDNVAAVHDGKVYAAFGYDGTNDTSNLYVLDPGTGSWTTLAPAADTRERPAAAFLGDKLYVAGGWGASGSPDPKLEIYDPASNSWTIGAPTPRPLAGSATAVLNGKLYVVGGCTASACGSTAVEVYDPASNSWAAAADYPASVSWEACGAIAGQIYCAGGTNDSGTSTATFAYDPGTDSWTPRASLPADLWGSAFTAANGMLLVSGGVTANSATVTNQGYAYDPSTDSWAPLPNSNQATYRGASACGFYQIGGSPGGSFVPPVATGQVLPGFSDCDATTDVPWLSLSPTTLTLAPGASAPVTVTLDASVAAITQPGTYTAGIGVSTDTPYSVSAVSVTMTVNPPRTWGKITGQVTSAVDGSPIVGATIQIDTWATSYTLKTDKTGHYALWLDVRNNPLQLIAAKDGFQPQTIKVRIVKLATTTVNFALKKA